jgi:hypothetical protein
MPRSSSADESIRDPVLNAHVAAAVAKDTPRGWRLDKSDRSAQIDAVVAMAWPWRRSSRSPNRSGSSAGGAQTASSRHETSVCLRCGLPIKSASYH